MIKIGFGEWFDPFHSNWGSYFFLSFFRTYSSSNLSNRRRNGFYSPIFLAGFSS